MALQIKSKNLDHLGLVSAIAKDLKLVERIDQRLEKDQSSKNVSMGQRVLALILNGLGFTDERLYMVSNFFDSKPLDRLIAPGIKAEHLNDDAFARLLNEIYDYGTTKLYAEIAFEIGQEQNLLGKNAHLDTTSFIVQGNYDEEDQSEEGIAITYGYSKDKRFDLKQVMLSLTSTGKAGFPIWMEALDGNASDKKSLHESLSKMKEFSENLAQSVSFTWVADSALYTIDKLLSAGSLKWITRVPETIKSAQELVSGEEAAFRWEDRGKGYQTCSQIGEYGGLKQRWLLVFSKQAYDREKMTLEKRILKEEEALKKALWHMGNECYACDKDAEKAIKVLRKKYHFHTIEAQVEAIEKFTSKGRPKEGSEKKRIGFCIKSSYEENAEAIEETLNRKGRFILATNELDTKALSDEAILREYKEQSSVEQGFRFLKDPWFMLDSIFLKKNERIEALMVIMTLCLMVYNVGEYRLRELLKEKNETLPNQLKKQVQNPTLRWIFKIMQGISVARVFVDQVKDIYEEVVINLCELTEKIIRYFGLHAISIYGLSSV